MSPDEAQDQIDRAVRVAESARSVLINALKTDWERWANDIVRRAVVEQPDISGPLSPPDLAVLKANLAMSIVSATSSIETLFSDELDAEALAAVARRQSGGLDIGRLTKPKEALVVNLYGLLENSGFRMDELKPKGSQNRSYSWDSFAGDDVELKVANELREYSASISKLAEAQLALEKMQKAIASDEVAQRWDVI